MIEIYYIGGSPCSGKSTIAEILSKRYGLYYFKVDDLLEKYTQMGKLKELEVCKKQCCMSAEEIWMREPKLQCREEFLFYEEIFDFIVEDLKQIKCRNIITEGAAYFPELIRRLNIKSDRYISITPTKEFQISHYKEREWVPFVLDGCSDKEKAFSNWMERDALYAEEVQTQCNKQKFSSIINDGYMNIDELVDMVAKHFGLEV